MRSIAGRLLAMTVGLALAGICGLGLLYGATVLADNTGHAELERALGLEHSIADLRSLTSDEESAVRGYLLSGDAELRITYGSRREGVHTSITSLAQSAAATAPGLSQRLLVLGEAIRTWETSFADPAILAHERADSSLLTRTNLVQGGTDDDPAYQLNASTMRWLPGDGTQAFHCPLRVPRAPE
ncbi:MAG: CHASE3 domain-containing protein, partial [Chloroflexota bacterium]